MKTPNRVSRSFGQLSQSQLGIFGRGVVTGMTSNPAFPTPFVPLADLSAGVENFITKQTAASNGGKLEIAQRDEAREALLGLLRQQAAYVEAASGDDLGTLLSSGFEAVNTNRTPIELPKPNIVRVENPASTKLALRVEPIPTARAYEVRMSYGTSGWQNVGIYTQARKIVIEDLTPGTTYSFQVRAIGGSTGASEWSDPTSHMSL